MIYEFRISQNQRLKFQTNWFRWYAWLVVLKYAEGALCTICEWDRMILILYIFDE